MLTHLIHMVGVDVGIAQCVNEITGFQACDLRHHHQQEGIGGDVEGYPQEDIGTALVKL